MPNIVFSANLMSFEKTFKMLSQMYKIQVYVRTNHYTRGDTKWVRLQYS